MTNFLQHSALHCTSRSELTMIDFHQRFSPVRLTAVAALIAGSGSAFAEQVQCATVQSGTAFKVELRANGGYFNCFMLEGTTAGTPVALGVTSDTNVSIGAEVHDRSATTGELILNQQFSGAPGALGVAYISTGQQAIVLRPSANAINKNVTFMYVLVDGKAMVFGEVNDVNRNVFPPTGSTNPPTDPTCTPGSTPRPCDPHLVTPVPLEEASMMMRANATPLCSRDTAPPPGRHPDFNTNQHLKKFENLRVVTETIASNGGRLGVGYSNYVKAFAMTYYFAKGQPYDLKVSAKFKSDQRFGNYFFGASMAVMGYSEDQAGKVAAAYQQYQNYSNPEHPAHNSLGTMVSEMAQSLDGADNDNGGDKADILQGMRYGNRVYLQDANRDKVGESCDRPRPVQTGLLDQTFPVGGGWNQYVFQGKVCINDYCGLTGGGSVWTSMPRPVQNQ